MQHARRLSLAALSVLLTVAIPATGASRTLSLDAWISTELTPYIAEQLRTHPRFKDQSLRFVVLANGKPQARSNALALDIRDRLREAASNVPGVHLAWQPDDPHYLRQGGSTGIDCTRSAVDYLVGIELELDEKGLLEVAVRALDVRDGTTIPHFGRKWTGPISSHDYREFRTLASDVTFRGDRDVPYEDTQTDLLAAHLAHDLGCSLLRQTEAEYVIARPEDSDPTAADGGFVELVGNNLAQYSALTFASGADSANAVIEGRAHRIDADLYQYWIVVTPGNAGTDRHALSASAYVRLPEKFVMAEKLGESIDAVPATENGYLAALKVVDTGKLRACGSSDIDSASRQDRTPYLRDRDCFALSVRSANDAVVFFLNHQLNHGLVRLAEPSCVRSDAARIVKSKQLLLFPLPADAVSSGAWAVGESWMLNPRADIYYVVAANSSAASRELSRLVRRLPTRCSASVRPGLDGPGLQRWLDELTRLIVKYEGAVDWQAVRVRNVY